MTIVNKHIKNLVIFIFFFNPEMNETEISHTVLQRYFSRMSSAHTPHEDQIVSILLPTHVQRGYTYYRNSMIFSCEVIGG